MSASDNGITRPPAARLVELSISYNQATGECKFVLPLDGNPLMLYGMLEYAKDEVRRQYIEKAQRRVSPIITLPNIRPGS